jgi:hypothetical protein
VLDEYVDPAVLGQRGLPLRTDSRRRVHAVGPAIVLDLRCRLGPRGQHALPLVQAESARRRDRIAADRPLAQGLRTEPGTITHQAAHLIDILPTLAELAGAEYPEQFAGRTITSRSKADRWYRSSAASSAAGTTGCTSTSRQPGPAPRRLEDRLGTRRTLGIVRSGRRSHRAERSGGPSSRNWSRNCPSYGTTPPTKWTGRRRVSANR